MIFNLMLILFFLQQVCIITGTHLMIQGVFFSSVPLMGYYISKMKIKKNNEIYFNIKILILSVCLQLIYILCGVKKINVLFSLFLFLNYSFFKKDDNIFMQMLILSMIIIFKDNFIYGFLPFIIYYIFNKFKDIKKVNIVYIFSLTLLSIYDKSYMFLFLSIYYILIINKYKFKKFNNIKLKDTINILFNLKN